MATIAAERPAAQRVEGLKRGGSRVVAFVLVVAALWGLWELYRWIWISTGWTWPFRVDDTTMPHIHDILRALFDPARYQGPLLVTVLLKAAWFTAKEAMVGFGMGALGGFLLGAVLAHFRVLQRGFLPWVVASQTVPILVVAPMVVVWLNPKLPGRFQDWGAVAVIAAYLTF